MLILRQIIVYLIAAFLLFSSTKNTFLISLYEMNKEVFISWFCENQSKPELKCDGNCQLSKMADEETHRNEAQIPVELEKEIFLYFESNLLLTQSCISADEDKTYGLKPQDLYSFLFYPIQDKPPAFLS